MPRYSFGGSFCFAVVMFCFVCIYPAWMEFGQLLECVDSWVSWIWGTFQPLFLWIFFLFLPFFLSGAPIICMFLCSLVSHTSLRRFTFFFLSALQVAWTLDLSSGLLSSARSNQLLTLCCGFFYTCQPPNFHLFLCCSCSLFSLRLLL